MSDNCEHGIDRSFECYKCLELDYHKLRIEFNQCATDFNNLEARVNQMEEVLKEVEKHHQGFHSSIGNKIRKVLGVDYQEPQLPRSNFKVTEVWTVECPYCEEDQEAPFNRDNPMSPLKHQCEECGEHFLITYERNE